MTANTDDNETSGTRRASDDVRRSFSALPLDQKLSTLIRIELDMLGDAVEAVASAVSGALDEVVDACAGSAPSGAANQTTTS